jgi:hypothetical protein
VALGHIVGQIERFLAEATCPETTGARAILATALDDAKAMAGAMTGYLMAAQQNAKELYRIGLQSVPFLLSVGDLLIGWLLLRQAELAGQALAGDPGEDDRAFYRGQDRGGELLRQECAAAVEHRAADLRRRRPRGDGARRRGVLGPERNSVVDVNRESGRQQP